MTTTGACAPLPRRGSAVHSSLPPRPPRRGIGTTPAGTGGGGGGAGGGGRGRGSRAHPLRRAPHPHGGEGRGGRGRGRAKGRVAARSHRRSGPKTAIGAETGAARDRLRAALRPRQGSDRGQNGRGAARRRRAGAGGRAVCRARPRSVHPPASRPEPRTACARLFPMRHDRHLKYGRIAPAGNLQ